MKLKEIEEMWRVDSSIDPLNTIEESRRTPLLHSKYNIFLNHEKLVLFKLEQQLIKLKKEVHQHCISKTPESILKFGNEPSSKRITIKEEIKEFVNSNELVLSKDFEVKTQQTKISFLESILWEISRRKDLISIIIRTRIFESGG